MFFLSSLFLSVFSCVLLFRALYFRLNRHVCHLADSLHADRTEVAVFPLLGAVDQFLNTTDYHRQHAPVGGKVIESREIQGVTYLGVQAVPIEGDAKGRTHIVRRKLNALDEPGYEFMQMRGLVVIQSKIGKVAILPMGMAQVSSIVVTAKKGTTLAKGDEISYFQFGDSDIVLVFERASNVSITAQPGVHYNSGTRIAMAYPVGE